MTELAILPSFFLTGPMALLALLFPALAASLGLILKRWKVLLLALTAWSSFALLHALWLKPWLSSRQLLDTSWDWLALIAISVALLPWAWKRKGALTPSLSRRMPSGECIGLAAMLVFGVFASVSFRPKSTGQEIEWIYECPDRGTIVSGPLLDSGRLYVGVTIDMPLRQAGRLCCLDATTGKPLWAFDANGSMKPLFSSPCIANNRLYIGEGFHRDAGCKLYCVDASTGMALWEHATKSHVESSPLWHQGNVFFGAGDDGLYCVDATTGKAVWHYEGGHIDGSPVASEAGVVVGVNRQNRYSVACLRFADGTEAWKTACELPAVGSPALAEGAIWIGMGNGTYAQSAPTPLGGVLVLDAKTGRELHQMKLPDSVLARPAIKGSQIAIACRDGVLRLAHSKSFEIIAETSLGSPLLAAPKWGNSLLQASEAGLVSEQFPATSYKQKQSALQPMLGGKVEVIATPAIFEAGSHRQAFIACGVQSGFQRAAVVVCLSLEAP